MTNKIMCECGGSYTDRNKPHHIKTKKHLAFIKENQEPSLEDAIKYVEALSKDTRDALLKHFNKPPVLIEPEEPLEEPKEEPLEEPSEEPPEYNPSLSEKFKDHVDKVREVLGEVDLFNMIIDNSEHSSKFYYVNDDCSEIQEQIIHLQQEVDSKIECSDEIYDMLYSFYEYLEDLGVKRNDMCPSFEPKSKREEWECKELLLELKANKVYGADKQFKFFENKANVKKILDSVIEEDKKVWMTENISSFIVKAKQRYAEYINDQDKAEMNIKNILIKYPVFASLNF